MVLLSEAEAEGIYAGAHPFPELVAKWFFVPKDYNEVTLCRQMRTVAKMIASEQKAITNYTIFTTTDCNARCFYCFEKNARRLPMHASVAEKTAGFIAGHCGGKKVSLSWFGGEPLFNREAIDIICRRLREKEVSFRSSMISNGYLFDKEMVRAAKDDWKLKKVQITLDGTQEVYNKAKAYIYKGVNPFERVIVNIHLLLDAGITVHIRLNIDVYNAEDLANLTNYLVAEFSGERNLLVYFRPLYGDSVHFAVDDPVKRRVVYEKIEQLQKVLDKAGLSHSYMFSRFIKTNRCMADTTTSLTVLPSGYFGKCEHYTDEYFVGHLDGDGKLDKKELSAFKELCPEIPECRSCPLYPDCIRLTRCTEAQLCFPEQRQEWLRQIRAGMRAAFYAKKDVQNQETTSADINTC